MAPTPSRFDQGHLLIRSVLTRALLLTVCLASAANADGPPAGATLELSDCRIHAAPGYPGVKARCGLFARRLDPDDPDSEVLQLNVAVIPALTLEPEPAPLIVIAGGPGQASTNFYASLAAAFEKVRRNRDILLVDQRGTGKSAAMTCEFDEDALDGQLSVEETVALARVCLDTLPHDPRFFTTSIAVRDLEALRQALGYPSLNLYGISYGTRVAQHYARRYPETTRLVILDGVAPPQIALGPGVAIEAQKALQSVFDRCAESESCNSAFPDIGVEFARLKTQLSLQPVTVVTPHPVTGKQETITVDDMAFALAIRLMNYNPSTVALMPLLIHEAAGGNFAPLAATFLTTSEGLSEQLAIGMHNAVVCTEDVPFYADLDGDALKETYIGPGMTETLTAICSVWPVGVIDDDLRLPLATDTPVLLLSGSADPITPPRFAELAAVELNNARHLVGKNQGHGQAANGCMPDIIGRFVATASVAIDDLLPDCMERVFAMPFFIDLSGPAP